VRGSRSRLELILRGELAIELHQTILDEETSRLCGVRASAMAGRILPIALATVAGISIGIATFEGEFKEQRKKRLEEEYKRYVRQIDGSTELSLTSQM